MYSNLLVLLRSLANFQDNVSLFFEWIWYQAQPRPTKQPRSENGTADAQGMPQTLIINNAQMYPAGIPTNLPPNYNAHFVTTTTSISGEVIKPQVGVEYTIASPAIGTVANSESQSTTTNYASTLGRPSSSYLLSVFYQLFGSVLIFGVTL